MLKQIRCTTTINIKMNFLKVYKFAKFTNLPSYMYINNTQYTYSFIQDL